MQTWLESILQDVRFAARGLARTPVSTAAAILAAAIGIGSATAVFSVVDRILFRPLPYPDEQRLVSLGFTAPIENNEFLLGADYYEWRGERTAFEGMTSWTGAADCDLTGDRPVRVTCARVEWTFLPTLGIYPAAGRNFTPEEDLPNGPKAALLTWGLWRSRFGGDRGIIGKPIHIDGEPRTVVGVLPEQFELPTLNRAVILIPQALNPAGQQRPSTGALLRAFARLRPGVSIEQAKTALAPYFARSLTFVPAAFRKEVQLRIQPLRDRQTQDARLASWTLLGAVIAVLLIACANVANLLLARSTARRKEVAVRLALGMSRPRRIAYELTESVLLGLFGGAAGCAIAWALLRVFIAIAPSGILRLEQSALDGRVLLTVLAASVVSGLLFGLAPALATPGVEALAETRTAGSRRRRAGHLMLATQIALSIVLLSAAGILLRSFWKLQNVPLGMRPEQVFIVELTLSPHDYPRPEMRNAFFEEAERRALQIPGVESAAVSDSVPPGGQTRSMIYTLVDVEGRPRAREGTGGMVVWRSVTPRFFETLRVPIVRGRSFDESDRRTGAGTVIIGEPLARRLFGSGEEPLGRRLRLGNLPTAYTVVGVAGPLKNAGLAGKDDPEYYLPRTGADPGRRAFLILRSRLHPGIVATQVMEQIGGLHPALPLGIETMEQRVAQLAARPRFNAMLLTSFALAGLALAAIGLYGLMSFLVARRTREIGVRMALGATRGRVISTVLSEAGRWTVGGCVAGTVASLPLSTVLRGLLFDAAPSDARVIAAAVALLLAVAFAAAGVPSRRAASVQPVEALRHD